MVTEPAIEAKRGCTYQYILDEYILKRKEMSGDLLCGWPMRKLRKQPIEMSPCQNGNQPIYKSKKCVYISKYI